MWKTTDRYVQQKRVKAVESEHKLKQVYVPDYAKLGESTVGLDQAGSGQAGSGRNVQGRVMFGTVLISLLMFRSLPLLFLAFIVF
jgi:hypothetical protein